VPSSAIEELFSAGRRVAGFGRRKVLSGALVLDGVPGAVLPGWGRLWVIGQRLGCVSGGVVWWWWS